MENVDIIAQIILLIILMGFSAFFSGSETAFSALTKAQIQRIRNEKKGISAHIIRFIDEPRRFFITVLFGNTLVNIAFITITGSLIYHELLHDQHEAVATIISVTVQLIILLLFGEITPKTFAVKHAEGIARVASLPLLVFSYVIFPFRLILRRLTDMVFSLLGIHGKGEQGRVTSDELKELVKAAEEEGVLDEQESLVIKNIFDLCDIDAKEAMTPRTDMVCLEVATTVGEAFLMAKKSGHSRLPVYRDSSDNICGIFYVKDLPRWKGMDFSRFGKKSIERYTIDEFLANRTLFEQHNPGNENTLIRQPFFCYEGKQIGLLMREITRKRLHLAVLLDEYGGVSGLITVEDIVEEVVGEILDEYDFHEDEEIVPVPGKSDVYRAKGMISIRNVNKRLETKIKVQNIDTLGGYVINLFGSIPEKGAVIVDKKHNLEFSILAMDGARIEELSIRRFRSGLSDTGNTHLAIPLVLMSLTIFLLAGTGTGSATGSGGAFSVIIFTVILLVSLIFIGFFAGSETAVVSASRENINALAESGDGKAQVIKKLLATPDRFLAMVLVGTNLMTAIAGQSGVMICNDLFQELSRHERDILNTVVVATIVLIFCELLPKTLFYAKADSLALKCAGLLRASDIVLWPIVYVVSRITNIVTRVSRTSDTPERQRISRDELFLMATMGGQEGALPPDQLKMIQNVLKSETRTIENVMIPLINIAALPETATVEEFYSKVAETGYSRIVVFEERVDNIVGFVNMLDVLYARKRPDTIKSFVRKNVSYEPETRQALPLLKQLQKTRNQMAFVVDEYGGVVGMITVEDLVEEIVGEIFNENEPPDTIREISKSIMECDGTVEINELNRHYDFLIPEGDYETIAGYVLHLTQKIPRQGEYVEAGAIRIMVLETDERKVKKVRIQKKSG